MRVMILHMLSTQSLSAFTASVTANSAGRHSIVKAGPVDAIRQVAGQPPSSFVQSVIPPRPGEAAANSPGSRMLPRGSLLNLSV